MAAWMLSVSQRHILRLQRIKSRTLHRGQDEKGDSHEDKTKLMFSMQGLKKNLWSIPQEIIFEPSMLKSALNTSSLWKSSLFKERCILV